MPERMTAVQLEHQGVRVTVRDVPTRFSGTGEELGFALGVTRRVEMLVREAVRQAGGQRSVEIAYRAAEIRPDPVSVELRRALRQRGVSSAQIARQLGVTPPVVSRWLSPDYHAHGLESLRRVAEVLDMEVEVRLVPKQSV